MESNGWKFDIQYHNYSQYLDSCGGDTWYGFSYPGTGSVSITLMGYGRVTLNFGNCAEGGVVKVFLNDNQQKLATPGDTNNNVNFPFSDGNVLKIVGLVAIIKLNFMEIKCIGNDYGNIK